MNTEAKDRDAERDKLAEVSNELEKLQAMLEDEQRKQKSDRQERHQEQELVYTFHCFWSDPSLSKL